MEDYSSRDRQVQGSREDEQTGQTLKAEEIQAMVVQEARRQMQEALAKDMKQVAADEARAEGTTQWQIEDGATTEAGEADTAGEAAPQRKAKVVVSYEDLVKAAEKTDIRKMIFAAAADTARTSQEYREVYHNYHRAFDSLLYKGNLSLGSRQYLRRYFRAIRPKKAAQGDVSPAAKDG